MRISNSQRRRARVRAWVKWLVIIPLGVTVSVLASLYAGYLASWIGTL